jgi:hypothetical protein
MSNNKDIMLKITKILEENELKDLENFIDRRHFINNCNLFLKYLFHLVQSAGILTTTVAAGYNNNQLIWIGVGLNILASLINVYEKINNNVLEKLMTDIKAIKEGNYVDESPLFDIENNDNVKKIPKNIVNSNTDNVITPNNNIINIDNANIYENEEKINN